MNSSVCFAATSFFPCLRGSTPKGGWGGRTEEELEYYFVIKVKELKDKEMKGFVICGFVICNSFFRRVMFGVLAGMVMGVAGCSDGGEERLPEGRYALEVTARVEDGSRGLDVKKVWKAGDRIGVKVTSANRESSSGIYRVTDDAGNVEAESAAYWRSVGEGTVTAWYPVDATDISTQEDGNADFDATGLDVLTASTTCDFGEVADLGFTHALARVRVDVMDRDDKLLPVKVSVLGKTAVEFREGVMTTGGGTGCIAAHAYARAGMFEALVVPGEIEVRVEVGGKSFIYTPAAGKMPEAGKVNSYTVKLKEVVLAGNKDMSISGSGEVILVGNGVTSGGITFDGDMTVALVNVNIEAYDGTPITVGGGKVTFELFGENRLVAETKKYSALYNAEGTTVTLRGEGTLVAMGGESGAGIGSGYQGTCGDITISGGEIMARGGLDGAGIGSGKGSQAACGKITISGGVVVAEGGKNGAGIGSGYYYSRCGEILISGGKVTATGGMEAAGIGCGSFFSTCGNITISGGEVKAGTVDEEKEAAAIGNGYKAEAPLVTLSNCVIRVPGDNGAVTGFNGIKAKKVEPNVTNAGELEKKGVTLVIGKLEEI